MKKIYVQYWAGKLDGLDFKDGEEFEYSVEKRDEIIDEVLSKDYFAMLKIQKDSGDLWVWIDDRHFTQR